MNESINNHYVFTPQFVEDMKNENLSKDEILSKYYVSMLDCFQICVGQLIDKTNIVPREQVLVEYLRFMGILKG